MSINVYNCDFRYTILTQGGKKWKTKTIKNSQQTIRIIAKEKKEQVIVRVKAQETASNNEKKQFKKPHDKKNKSASLAQEKIRREYILGKIQEPVQDIDEIF